MIGQTWSIELLGKLEAAAEDVRLKRFRTRSAGLLLAYLALHPKRMHLREELAERFWPDLEDAAGRNRLKQDLASLRRQMEGAGVQAGIVLRADRTHLSLNPESFTSDVAAFETRLCQAGKTSKSDECLRLLTEAAALYKGELLPGFHADWILPERERLANLYVGAVREVVTLLEQSGEAREAISYAHLALTADPLHEPTHGDLLRLYAATGQIPAAARHYELIQLTWKKELDLAPSDSLRALAESLLPRALIQGCTPLPTPPRTRSRLCVVPAPDAQELEPARQSPPSSCVPRLLTRFFGREQEIARLTSLLAPENIASPQERLALLTLTGSGGSGKTRLALEAAARLCLVFQQAVWFVPLADISDPRLIEDRILQSLNLPRSPHSSPLEQIRARLIRQPCLLVLDNFEHLVEEGAEVVRALLQAAPTLACLVTSRRRLHLEGEREFAVAPLPLPAPSQSPTEQMRCACVALFVDRAQAARADFQITPRNSEAIAGICARLEGLPLALELAASRIGAISPAHMLIQLENRLEFLVSRRRDIETRHRTLRAAIAWSYDLLTPGLQRFFARLCVFRGGWTREAAQTVCGVPDALTLLEELQARSLIGVTDTDDGLRFSMLETLREFGQEQLTAEETNGIQQSHAECFKQLAATGDLLSGSSAANATLPRLTAELENFRAALTWALKEERIGIGLGIAGALRDFWYFYGHLVEGCEWLEALLAKAENVDPAVCARAYLAQGDLWAPRAEIGRACKCYEQSLRLYSEGGAEDFAAIVQGRMGTFDTPVRNDLLQASLEAGQRAGSLYAVAFASDFIGRMKGCAGDYQGGMDMLKQSLAIYRSLNADLECSALLHEMGYLAARQGEYAGAIAYHEQGLAIARQWKIQPGVAAAQWHLGGVMLKQGDYIRAKHLLEESLAQRRQIGQQNGVADTLATLGQVVEAQGDFAQAQSLYEESLAIRRTLAITGDLVHSLSLLGWNREYAGEGVTARMYFEEGAAACERVGFAWGLAPCLAGLGRRACCEGDTKVSRRHVERALALCLHRDNPRETAFCLGHFTDLLSAEGRSADAVRLLAAVHAMRNNLSIPPHAGEQGMQERRSSELRVYHREREFERLWAEGDEWRLKNIVACILAARE